MRGHRSRPPRAEESRGAAHLEEVLLQIVEQLRLSLVLAKHRGHLLLEVADDEGMGLGQANTLDKLVDLWRGDVR